MMKRRYVVIALALIAALAIASPGIGVSLKKLVKKEVAKQISKATGPPGASGAPGAPGTPGADGTARAYARVTPHPISPCTGPPTGLECDFDRSKGVTSVFRLFLGVYCVVAPGISADDVPAAVTVDHFITAVPEGNASAMVNTGGCGDGEFQVITQRQPVTTVRDEAGTGTTEVAGNATLADDVGFTIVIP